ncbi:MAG TPA: hypothetical protein PK970_12970 [Hyphomicrobiaceae bacterium]|nr:hypothetical protein [Hyphomicrobiaceae bacterium]
MTPDDTVWEDIRRAYEHSDILIPEILKTYRIDAKALAARRKSEGWTPRKGVAGRKHKQAPDDASLQLSRATAEPEAPHEPEPKDTSPSAKAPKPPTPSRRRALVARLSAAIDKKLALLERRMDRVIDAAVDEPPSSADIERDIRAIGALMKNLEQATDNDRAATGKSGRGGTGTSRDRTRDATASSDTADRIRRELGERLQRLVEAAGKDT